MKELQSVLSTVRQAVEHYGMIGRNDRIAVAVSGGKDSLATLLALQRMRSFYPVPYELTAITVDPGFPGEEDRFAPVRSFCRDLGVPYEVIGTEIARVVFDVRKEKNPCSLCASMRRGALVSACRASGTNKLALGHHLDDAVETFMMSLLLGGRIGCFSPVTVYEDSGLTVIRPLVYTEERAVKALVRAADLPVVPNPCPEDGTSERRRMKDYLRSFDRDHRGLYDRVIGAMERAGVDGWEAGRPDPREE